MTYDDGWLCISYKLCFSFLIVAGVALSLYFYQRIEFLLSKKEGLFIKRKGEWQKYTFDKVDHLFIKEIITFWGIREALVVKLADEPCPIQLARDVKNPSYIHQIIRDFYFCKNVRRSTEGSNNKGNT